MLIAGASRGHRFYADRRSHANNWVFLRPYETSGGHEDWSHPDPEVAFKLFCFRVKWERPNAKP